MNKFFKDISLISMPLIMWSVFVLLIDPFNYFDFMSLISRDIKERNSKKLNGILYNIIDYCHEPCENLIIGDSRIESLPINEIENVSGEKYKILALGSAKLNELFDLVYFSNTKIKLKHVVIGINFSLLNEYSFADRVPYVKEILKNPLKYIFNKNIAQACYYVIKAKLTGENVTSIPPMSREEFWQYWLTQKAFDWYGKYRYSEKLNNDLLALDNFAKENNIKLTLIIVPLNTEFRNKLVEFGLSKEENRFKTTLGKLSATVIDYDYENAITNNKDYFSDPAHYNSYVAHLIINEVWKNSLIIGRRLK